MGALPTSRPRPENNLQTVSTPCVCVSIGQTKCLPGSRITDFCLRAALQGVRTPGGGIVDFPPPASLQRSAPGIIGMPRPRTQSTPVSSTRGIGTDGLPVHERKVKDQEHPYQLSRFRQHAGQHADQMMICQRSKTFNLRDVNKMSATRHSIT